MTQVCSLRVTPPKTHWQRLISLSTFTVSLSYLCLYHLFLDEGVETL
jgi:hypothetical protein